MCVIAIYNDCYLLSSCTSSCRLNQNFIFVICSWINISMSYKFLFSEIPNQVLAIFDNVVGAKLYEYHCGGRAVKFTHIKRNTAWKVSSDVRNLNQVFYSFGQ